MFFDPNPTPFDLRFRIFRTDVRVNPWFWLVAVWLGWDLIDGAVMVRAITPQQRLPYLLLWVACVFASILLHEMGHVLMGRCFGSDGHIVLYSFGGLAIGSNQLKARWQRIAVSAAGPAIQLALYGLLTLLLKGRSTAEHPIHLSQAVRYTLRWLLWINLYWALFNLLPIWPLDGGMISREVFTGFSRNRGVAISLFLSMGLAAALAVNEFVQYQKHYSFLPSWLSMGGDIYMAVFFAIFAINNYFEYQALRYQHREAWDQDGW